MNITTAWNNMDSNTKSLVVQLYARYKNGGRRDDLEQLKAIFKNHGYGNPSESELERVLRR